MSFGKRLTQARKKKGISQEELAGQLNTKGPVIGRYELDEMKPSIEAATNMAKILEVSLDWLVGNTDTELDTATLNRIQDISKLSQKDKELVFEFLDSFISNRKIKNVLQWSAFGCWYDVKHYLAAYQQRRKKLIQTIPIKCFNLLLFWSISICCQNFYKGTYNHTYRQNNSWLRWSLQSNICQQKRVEKILSILEYYNQ